MAAPRHKLSQEGSLRRFLTSALASLNFDLANPKKNSTVVVEQLSVDL